MKCKLVSSYISCKLLHLWYWTYNERLLVKHKIKLTVDVIFVTGFRKERHTQDTNKFKQYFFIYQIVSCKLVLGNC